MREYRLVYNSPCGADQLRKTGYVGSRIHVCVPPVSARTGEAMLIPFSESPANSACLARVSRVDETHGDSQSRSFVSDKVLQLTKRPSVQACPDSFPGLDAVPDMGQIFHADCTHVQPLRLLGDGFGYFVVDVFHMPSLPTGESAQLSFGGAAPVGLETAAMGKVAVPLKPQFPAAKDLATARGGEIVFPHIDAQDTPVGHGSDLRELEDEVGKTTVLSGQSVPPLWASRRSSGWLDACRRQTARFPARTR